MNWLIKLYDEQGQYLVAKHRYLDYSRREAERLFRETYGLKGKRIADRLWVEKLGAVQ